MDFQWDQQRKAQKTMERVELSLRMQQKQEKKPHYLSSGTCEQ